LFEVGLNNSWTDSAIDIDVSGVANIDAASLDIDTTGIIDIATPQDLTIAGDVATYKGVTAIFEGTTDAFIVSATTLGITAPTSINVTSPLVDCSGAVDAATGFKYNGTAGVTVANWLGGGIATGTDITEIDASELQPTVTVANWLGGGIATGTDITEIDASELQPTDKILVRR